jgi:type VI secretion system VasI family protein
LFVVFNSIVASANGVKVQYRVGDAAPATEQWISSQDNRAFGLWKSKLAISLIRKLEGAEEFYIRGDGNLGTSEALFKLSGVREAVAPVRKTCGW